MAGRAAEELASEDSSDDSLKEHGHRYASPPRLSAATWRLEILCGITVGLALVPEAVAFALAGDLEPVIGLNSTWIIAILSGILGGRPAMICGAAGSLAVLVAGTVKEGKEYLFYAVILSGVVQIILGLLQLGSLVKLIPTPVMMGFCNGLALIIGLSQLSSFKVPHSQHGVAARRLGAFDAFTDGAEWIGGVEGTFAGMITAISFFTCLFLPKLTKRMPSALVAIIVGSAFEWIIVRAICKSRTTTVVDIAALTVGGSFPIPMWFDHQYTPPPLNMDTFEKTFSLAMTLAAVGLLESLMTLSLVDEITRSGHSSTRRECIGLGVANIVCGAFGGMGGCALIGQSMINIGSGARKRVSSISAGVVLMLIVLVAGPVINGIPVSALVGVMFNVVFHTFEWTSLKLIALAAMPLRMRNSFFSKATTQKKIRRWDALIILAVTLVTLFTNLATAVGVGMLFALFSFALDSSELIRVTKRASGGGPESSEPRVRVYDVQGMLFFGSTSKFLGLFDEDNDPKDVYLNFESGHIADYSAIEALNKLAERYGAQGKRLTLQELKPESSKIIRKAAGLLVEEITLAIQGEEVIPSEREHLNVEHFPGIDPTLVMSEAQAAAILSNRPEESADEHSNGEDSESSG